MSIATWRKQYYPSSAHNITTDKGAVIHSLRKWKGLTPTNLRKHHLSKEIGSYTIEDISGRGFNIDGNTCALCHLHCPIVCENCPLQNERGGAACDEPMLGEYSSPYSSFKVNNDPKPMIKLLTAAMKTQLKKENV